MYFVFVNGSLIYVEFFTLFLCEYLLMYVYTHMRIRVHTHIYARAYAKSCTSVNIYILSNQVLQLSLSLSFLVRVFVPFSN